VIVPAQASIASAITRASQVPVLASPAAGARPLATALQDAVGDNRDVESLSHGSSETRFREVGKGNDCPIGSGR
jgi:hypothetical protein